MQRLQQFAQSIEGERVTVDSIPREQIVDIHGDHDRQKQR